MHTPLQTTASNPTISDFRRNAQRQAREQQSVGNFLSFVIYGLVGIVILSAVLASYGGYIIYQQVQDQSATVAQLDSRLGQETKVLKSDLAKAQEDLQAAQQSLQKQQALTTRQQDQITRLNARVNELGSTIKSEQAARSREIIDLRRRSSSSR